VADYDHAQMIGVLAFLLPYIEQENLYKKMTQSPPTPDYFSVDVVRPIWITEGTAYDNIWAAAQARVSTFLCPSDDAYSNTQKVFVLIHSYPDPSSNSVVSQGKPLSLSVAGSLGRTNYIGVSGLIGRVGNPDIDMHQGIFYNRSKVTIAQIAAGDGTSNTFMFGEWLGNPDVGPRQYAGAWMGCGALPAAWGTATGADSNFDNWTSKHTNVVQFANGDGSVRRVRKGITPPSPLAHPTWRTTGSASYKAFIYAAGWGDAQIIDESSF
jgi:hypothetical protein